MTPIILRLTRDLARPIWEPQLPAGVALAPFSATLSPRVHALMRHAYADGGGSVPEDFETWWAATWHDPEFDARLCFVAVADAEPVGFALCWTSGFVKDLVVDAAHRQRGIGTALLLTALHAFAVRGLAMAALRVHADNLNARRVYARLGFIGE